MPSQHEQNVVLSTNPAEMLLIATGPDET